MGWEQRGGVILPTVPVADTYFGDGVGLSDDGNVLVVSADGLNNGQGGVYVFDRSGNGFVQQADILYAPDPGDYDYFGWSIDLSNAGDRLVVGAPQWDAATGGNVGALYIFAFASGQWSLAAGPVTAVGWGVTGDRIGLGIAIDTEGRVYAGAPQRDSPIGTNHGTVIRFSESGGVHVKDMELPYPADLDQNDRFGSSIDISNNRSRLVVGSPRRDGAGNDRGAVYTYQWDGYVWSQVGEPLIPADAQDYDYFGCDVALSGNGLVLFVGAKYRFTTLTDQGAVYVFDWNGFSWDQRGAPIIAGDAQAYDEFGTALATNLDGGVIAIGAPYWSTEVTGGAYVFDFVGQPIERVVPETRGYVAPISQIVEASVGTAHGWLVSTDRAAPISSVFEASLIASHAFIKEHIADAAYSFVVAAAPREAVYSWIRSRGVAIRYEHRPRLEVVVSVVYLNAAPISRAIAASYRLLAGNPVERRISLSYRVGGMAASVVLTSGFSARRVN